MRVLSVSEVDEVGAGTIGLVVALAGASIVAAGGAAVTGTLSVSAGTWAVVGMGIAGAGALVVVADYYASSSV